MGPFVLDFCCLEASLVVEVDGPCHLDRFARDRRRDHWLRTHGMNVLRLSNEQVLLRPAQALQRIREHLAARPEAPLL